LTFEYVTVIIIYEISSDFGDFPGKLKQFTADAANPVSAFSVYKTRRTDMAYTGRVLKRRTGEPMENIPVSDGRNTVLTDAEGRYTLDGWERARIINVGVLTRRQSDWYISIDDREGDYDFFIDKADTSEIFSFMHTSDTEIEERPFADFISFMRDEVAKHNPAFFINTGDLCRDDGVKRHYLAMNCETLGCPVRYAIGNHDFIGKDYGESIYEKFYGPTWYSFDCGNIHFVVLSIGCGDNPSGYERDDQWHWLIEDLKKLRGDKKVIVCCHDLCCADETGFDCTVGNAHINLRENGLAAWVFGHYHINFAHDYNGVLDITTARPDSGGIDSSPAGIRKINVVGTEVSTEMIYNMPQCDAPSACVWSTQLCGNVEYCTPVEQDGDIFVGTADDGYPKKCGVWRVDGTNGKIKWHFATSGSVKGDIALCNGKVYAQDCTCKLYCLDAADGSVIWSAYSEISRANYTRSGVLMAEDLVIAGTPAHVYAYNAADGSLVWHNNISRCETTPARFVYDKAGGNIIVSQHWKCLTALDVKTGEIKWQNFDRVHCWYRTATPLVSGNEIYVAGMANAARLDAESGKTVFTEYIAARVDVGGAPVLSDGKLYFPTGNSGVVAVEEKDFKVSLFFPAGRAKLFSSPYIHGDISTVEGTPVIWGNRIIFGSSDGSVYVYDKTNAKLIKRLCAGAPITASPIVSDNYIVAADYSGKITKFRV